MPTDASTGVARFLDSRGEGFHHVCLEVADVDAELRRLAGAGIELIDQRGAQGRGGTGRLHSPAQLPRCAGRADRGYGRAGLGASATDVLALPTGTVTFLFTDIEGSTQLLHELGPRLWRGLGRPSAKAAVGVRRPRWGRGRYPGRCHLRRVRRARDAVLGRRARLRAALSGGPIHVRMGIHTGHRAWRKTATWARTCISVLGSVRPATAGRSSSRGPHVQGAEPSTPRSPCVDLGEHRLKDFASPVWIYQLGAEAFPPLRTISNTNLRGRRLPSLAAGGTWVHSYRWWPMALAWSHLPAPAAR